MTAYEYFEGGNPPTLAGMFRTRESARGREHRGGDRIAWWPAGFAVTQVNMSIIIQEFERTGRVVTRQRAIELLSEDEVTL